MGTMEVAVTATAWCAGSIANNVVTKKAMMMFPYPLTVAYVGLLVQLLVGFLQQRHRSSGSSKNAPWKTVTIIAVGILGNFIFHRIALKNATVPFALTAKSSGTVFSATLCLLWLQEPPDWRAWLCITLLICGITIAACTEFHFSWLGMLAAFLSAFS